jgi:hypothetical protein
MRHAATTWTFASAGNRLAELMKLFECADLIAPWDTEAFGNRMGELVRRGERTLLEVKARLEAEFAAETERSGGCFKVTDKGNGCRRFPNANPPSISPRAISSLTGKVAAVAGQRTAAGP